MDIPCSERQMKDSLDKIVPDHLERYKFAAEFLQQREDPDVLDVGCGVGYGSYIMSDFAKQITCYDISTEARAYWELHYQKPNVEFVTQDIRECDFENAADVAVSFEFIEHVENPRPILSDLSFKARYLLCSVPNEVRRPYNPEDFPHHYRHYTPKAFRKLLKNNGWNVMSMNSQKTKKNPIIRQNLKGKTLVAVCRSRNTK